MPLTRDLVLVGGGHAHALVLKAWGMDPLPGARLTVINPGPTAPYTGMLPGHVAGHYARGALEIDLVRLCRHAGARLILDKATGIDRTEREVILAGRGPVAYDVASIDVGITAQMDLPGFAEHGVGAKPLDVFASRWRQYVRQVADGVLPADIAVIGGGVAGCELAMAMAHRLRDAGHNPSVTVIEAGSEITGVGASGRARMLKAMAELGVEVRTGAQVSQIQEASVEIKGQAPVPAALCVGAAGAYPHDWIAQTDLPLIDGFVEVGADLGVVGDDSLFAVGDCAVMPHAPRPKAGVFAVRAAPVLKHNLRAALQGRSRRTWVPQKNYLKLISLGGKSAMAEKFGMTWTGPLMWRWKDRIDQAFMDRLGDLPKMPIAAPPKVMADGAADHLAGEPLCGGCGAKVGRRALSGVIETAALAKGSEIVAGAGDDAAILRLPGGTFQVISTDHLRGFNLDHAMMARIAAVHALGDVWAMGAKPQVALSSIILPEMSDVLQARTLTEVSDVTREVFEAAGAHIVGGHTTMGAELTLGFTVTGTCEKMPLTVAGAKEGDLLILTRPIGAGVLLAADMQGLGKGRDLTAALETMSTPQDREAAVLAAVAHAMTDVTGFGLAGHVQIVCAASGLDAEIWGGEVPVYQGARLLSDEGVASVLMSVNRGDVGAESATDPLLFDPQTAGGLLAAVAEVDAPKVLNALEEEGCQGWIIGKLRRGAGQMSFR